MRLKAIPASSSNLPSSSSSLSNMASSSNVPGT